MRAYEDLVAEAMLEPVDGWGFGFLEGRAAEERPPWGFAQLLAERWADADAALDLQTGGGEVLAEALAAARRVPPVAVATESWAPNAALATERLERHGAIVVVAPEQGRLPFADGAFDLVTSRHPVRVDWEEIARVLMPGGTYFAQHVGPYSGFELIEWFTGPLSEGARMARQPGAEAAGATAVGLDVVDLRTARLELRLDDVGAVVWLLRKLVWWVPEFSVERYDERLRALDERMRASGPFVAHSTRQLLVARKPD